MIRISKLADYAASILHHLACHPDQGDHASAIAETIQIGLPTTTKVLKLLVQANLLQSSRGVKGGYKLARPVADITLAEVIAAIDGEIALTQCTHGECDRKCHCHLSPHWCTLNTILETFFENLTLADMMQRKLTRSDIHTKFIAAIAHK